MTNPASWRLDRFGECLDRWKEQESPSVDLVEIVLRWTLTRLDDPYTGMRREPDFPNLWFGGIPGTIRGDKIVTCSYWIYARDYIVTCNGYGTLGMPL